MIFVQNRRADGTAFQFNLRHLFWLVSLFGVYFGLVRSIGPFVATLTIGTFILVAILILLRIDNMVHGAVMGAIIAVVILVFASLAAPQMPSSLAAASWFLYPPIGYALGVICAADRELRSG